MKRRFLLALLLAVAVYASVLMRGAAASGAPVVEKIDPPGWWIGHSINPIQLLIHGRGLDQATLRTDAPGLSVVSSTTSQAGDYLIAYLAIDPKHAAPGNIAL